ncbi:MAG: FliH/SctL family protein [Candidatus Melainabacteria bacterium]|nr:FliH/SctL family protein [Candidatus Melainabacteria bacterium]
MALIKKAKLEAIYGVDEALETEVASFDEQPVETPALEAGVGEALSLEDEQELGSKVDQLVAQKDAELAQVKEAALLQIDQELEAAKLQAQEILVEASEQADSMRNQLDSERQEFEQARAEQARLLEQQRQQIEAQAMSKADDYINQLMQILSSFHKFKADILAEAKDEIAGLALSIAKQVLGEHAKLDETLIIDQVKSAISKLAVSSGLIEISIHPDDLERKADLEQDLARILDTSVRISFLEDSAVDQGSCLIKTSGGRLDASFSSQFELIRVAFERYLGHKISEIQDLDGLGKGIEMTADPNANNANLASEPSDSDLEMIGELDLADLEIDEDMDKLLQDVLNSDADVQVDASVKIDDDISLDKADADEELGLNDTLLDEGASEEEETESEENEEGVEFEEFNEFAEDPELAEDSNFDGSAMDDRFPEY